MNSKENNKNEGESPLYLKQGGFSMKINGLFNPGQKVWVKEGNEVLTMTFKEGEVRGVGKEELLIVVEGQSRRAYLMKEVQERVFLQTPNIDLYVKKFLSVDPVEKPKTKNLFFEEIEAEMLTLQFCNACLENQRIEEPVEIEGLNFLGTAYQFFGELENYYLLGVYELNGLFYVSYEAGNNHVHIGRMQKEMAEELKGKLNVV